MTQDNRNSRPTCTEPTSWLSGGILAFAASAALMAALPIAAVADAKFTVSPLAEMRVAELPADPLYWHVQSFPSLDEAKAAAGPETPSLTAEFDECAGGVRWLLISRVVAAVSSANGPGSSEPHVADAATVAGEIVERVEAVVLCR